MEKIIFFGLVVPILGFVLYLGGSAIMNGFNAKKANKNDENIDDEKIQNSLNEENKLSDEIDKLNKLLKISENADAIFVSDSKNLELNPYWGAYNISKLGLEALVNTWRKEINLTNIKAHIFIPEDMDTQLRSSFMPGEKNKNLKQPDEIASKLIKLIRKIW